MCSRSRNDHVERNNTVCRCLPHDPQSPLKGALRQVVASARPQEGNEGTAAPGHPHRQSRRRIHRPHQLPHCLQFQWIARPLGRKKLATSGKSHGKVAVAVAAGVTE